MREYASELADLLRVAPPTDVLVFEGPPAAAGSPGGPLVVQIDPEVLEELGVEGLYRRERGWDPASLGPVERDQMPVLDLMGAGEDLEYGVRLLSVVTPPEPPETPSLRETSRR